MTNTIEDDFLKKYGKILYTGEYALLKNDALKYIELLKNKKFILGGDLYVEKDGELCPDAANWFIEPESHTIEDSIIKSQEFIKQFNESKNLFFVFVLKKDKS